MTRTWEFPVVENADPAKAYMHTLVPNKHSNNVTLTFYASGKETLQELLDYAIEMVKMHNYIIEVNGEKYPIIGLELASHKIDNFTISAGLPHNDYGQTIKIEFTPNTHKWNVLTMGS